MKNISKLLLLLAIIAVIGMSGCGTKARKTAPSSVSVSRYAHIEESFEIIAESIDPEEVFISIQEVLELCESGDVSMLVYKTIAETRLLFLDTTVRVYMDYLQEIGNYDERINSVDYNDEGLITRIVQTRE